MPTFQFTLIIDGADFEDAEFSDAVFEAGCDDALIGRSGGVQYVDFDREADSFEKAAFSAVHDLEMIDGIRVVRLADAGLVSMAEIAARTGRTRESVRLLIAGERGPGGFPAPLNDPRNRYRLWRSTDVSHWFGIHFGDHYAVGDDRGRIVVNEYLESTTRAPHLQMGGIDP